MSADDLAWVCNQDDGCWGFVYNKQQGYGGWLLGTGGLRPEIAEPRTDIYEKNRVASRKADQGDISNPSILPKNQSTTRIHARHGNPGSTWDDYSINTGVTCAGMAGYPRANDMDGYRIPLGWKWMIIDGSGSIESYHDRENGGQGGEWTLDSPTWHNMLNKDDCVLAQNVGFDIDANFDSMVSKFVTPEDATIIKYNWCRKEENIEKVKCTNFFSTPEALAKGYNYNTEMANICNTKTDWYTRGSCRAIINENVKGNNASLKQQGQDKVAAYCNTTAGETQADGICACYNVTKHGAKCLTDKKGVPGCSELYATIGDLPGGAQVAFSDTFCASTSCVSQALNGSAVLLPSYTASKTCPNIQQCIADYRGANFQGASVSQECKNTLSISGVPPPPGAPPPPPPSGGGSPPPPPPPSGGGASPPSSDGSTPPSGELFTTNEYVTKYADTRERQEYGLGGISCFLFLCCCCLFILMMSGGDSGGGGGFDMGSVYAMMAAGKSGAVYA